MCVIRLVDTHHFVYLNLSSNAIVFLEYSFYNLNVLLVYKIHILHFIDRNRAGEIRDNKRFLVNKHFLYL